VAILACAGSSAPSARAAEISPALKKLVADANAEGRLDISWGSTSIGGNEGAETIEKSLRELWGSTVDIRFTPGPSMPAVGHQIAREYAAGQKAFSDVYFANGAYIVPLLPRNIFLKVDWQALLPDREMRHATEEDGQFMRIYSGMSGVTYNTRLAPMKPTSLADFLKPEWKGKIASTPYAAGFDTISANDIWGPQKTLDYVRELSQRISGLLRCSDLERIASGEFLALVMDCSGQDAFTWKDKGAPIDQMIPRDAAQIRYYYMSVPKNAAHPNAAKLMIAYMATRQGQDLLWKVDHTDLHLYEGSKIAPTVKKLQSEGVKLTEVSLDWIQSHPETQDAKAEAIKILTTKQK
jgi:ABC-type Fe3+ transport system substrate-binding protein